MLQTIWESERRLWLEGSEAYDELLHPRCIMVFADPVGVLKGDAISESLKGVPRWTEVEMAEQSSSGDEGNVVVIAYRAKARRGDAAPYDAYCSSTYIRNHESWRIIQHQQTPIG